MYGGLDTILILTVPKSHCDDMPHLGATACDPSQWQGLRPAQSAPLTWFLAMACVIKQNKGLFCQRQLLKYQAAIRA